MDVDLMYPVRSTPMLSIYSNILARVKSSFSDVMGLATKKGVGLLPYEAGRPRFNVNYDEHTSLRLHTKESSKSILTVTSIKTKHLDRSCPSGGSRIGEIIYMTFNFLP